VTIFESYSSEKGCSSLKRLAWIYWSLLAEKGLCCTIDSRN